MYSDRNQMRDHCPPGVGISTGKGTGQPCGDWGRLLPDLGGSYLGIDRSKNPVSCVPKTCAFTQGKTQLQRIAFSDYSASEYYRGRMGWWGDEGKG